MATDEDEGGPEINPPGTLAIQSEHEVEYLTALNTKTAREAARQYAIIQALKKENDVLRAQSTKALKEIIQLQAEIQQLNEPSLLVAHTRSVTPLK